MNTPKWKALERVFSNVIANSIKKIKNNIKP
jgi:hypothetical protein